MPAKQKSSPSIVVIGGGTGSFAILQAVKTLTNDVTALVSMVDDGGSTGVLRDELGVLPPGDIRQCLIALSRAPDELRELFNFRFPRGTFAGHSFGNLFLSAVEMMRDDFADSIRMASDVLRIRGTVLPITLHNVRLVLHGSDGRLVRGQHAIDSLHFSARQRKPALALEPTAPINPAAERAIRQADMVIIAPGDMYTSLGPALVVNGVGDALRASTAKRIYMCNLVVKPGHTDGLSVAGHADEIERLAGGAFLDYVFYNTTQPAAAVMDRYATEGEVAVNVLPKEFEAKQYQAFGRPLVAPFAVARGTGPDAHFAVLRSFIRHDKVAVTAAIKELL